MSFHLYTINELYSNADGSIQFIEMSVGNFNGQGFWDGNSISDTQNGVTHSFTFPSDLPSEQTANTEVLIATQGFANLGIVTPDFIIPANFLFINGGTFNYANVDSWTYSQLPTDGSNALYRNSGVAPAVATDFTPAVPNTPPPAGTTADMILRGSNNSFVPGQYKIYDIGSNAILAGSKLGQVGTDWQFAGLGGFNGTDTTDMLLRSASTGGFEVYDISNNNITNAAFLGAVGMNWQVMGFGNFSSFGETDMIMRSANTGGVEVYDISNNQITGAAFMGTVGLDWQVVGFGDFTSMPGETDMIMRNTKTGGLEVYDIANNQITGAAFMGTVGLDWQVAGFGPMHAGGTSDMVLRNVNINTGPLEVYDISNNQITAAARMGDVVMDWQLGGFAAAPSTASTGDASQLVQAMAGFGGGGGAPESLNAVPLGADTSQQPLLTAAQHA